MKKIFKRREDKEPWKKIREDLSNVSECLPASLSAEQRAEAQTRFFKNLALEAHSYTGGKMQTVPKVAAAGSAWYSVWYTPGVSAVSTAVRDDPARSFALSNRSNLVAVVSDSTRVLGDGDVGPAGGLGVMEGKALLMKQLGGVDAVALCVDARGRDGRADPAVLVDLVARLQPSFGAVNLEDISQPNCYRVLDELRARCEIPVWHDDQQGTACVTLAGLLNALRLAGKDVATARFVFWGAGAASTTSLRLLVAAGADPRRCVMFDSRGALHRGRADIARDPRYYRKWEVCRTTNPRGVTDVLAACAGADALVALSRPGPRVVRPEWIKAMAPRPVVFACANPVPEIYPHEAQAAGAFVVATGRGDYPNQVNNSVCFPGLLKGALLARARAITDGMALAAARSLARFAWARGATPTSIVPRMDERAVFPTAAADVAMQAVREGVARTPGLTWDGVYRRAEADIAAAARAATALDRCGAVRRIPRRILVDAMRKAVEQTCSSGCSSGNIKK